MNISEQLNLLQNIKEDIKTKLIETGADINENTHFSQYPQYIKQSDKSVFTDKVFSSKNIKEITQITISDSIEIQ